ncbi:unnamed protein product, partial [Didymodactylos carnosus]
RYLDADLVMGLEADMRQFCVGFPRCFVDTTEEGVQSFPRRGFGYASDVEVYVLLG